MDTTLTPSQLKRLPLYAREELRRRAMRIAELEEQLNRVTDRSTAEVIAKVCNYQYPPRPIYANEYVFAEADAAHRVAVTFNLNARTAAAYGWAGIGPHLLVRGESQVVVHPRASNTVLVAF